jgi:hypothetical protein
MEKESQGAKGHRTPYKPRTAMIYILIIIVTLVTNLTFGQSKSESDTLIAKGL